MLLHFPHIHHDKDESWMFEVFDTSEQLRDEKKKIKYRKSIVLKRFFEPLLNIGMVKFSCLFFLQR
jgi:hypothetical protein